MKVEDSQVTKFLITEVDGLDAITVILEDLGPRKGKINIDCYDQAWSAYWGGMGSRTIAEFFCSCDEHYLAKNLSHIPLYTTDYDAINSKAKEVLAHKYSSLLKDRREGLLTENEAREQHDKISDYMLLMPDIECELTMAQNEHFMLDLFGDDWRYNLPTKPSNEYQYLCRIINAVKEALKSIDQIDQMAAH